MSEFHFLHTCEPIDKHANRLPHWQQKGCMQFVTWTLGDALPAVKRAQIARERAEWVSSNPKPWSDEQERTYYRLFSERMQEWLDAGGGDCVLKQPRISRIVADALHYFDGERLVLDSYVVMPNHVHVLFAPNPDHTLERILKSWKGFTARLINQRLNRSGSLWMKDYWDRLIRSREHYLHVRRYIAENPQKANLPPHTYLLWQR
jgi:REP element-mobilizing transposase RayT